MPTFTPTELKRTAMGSGILAVMGLILVLATRSALEPEAFWHPYQVATGAIGYLLLIFGLAWCALALVHAKTAFFNPTRALDAGGFSASLGAIVVAVVILIGVILPRLPETPPSQLPMDPSARQSVVRMEANFKGLVALGIIATGAAIGSGPFRRFFRR